jgi:hypothetical protein
MKFFRRLASPLLAVLIFSGIALAQLPDRDVQTDYDKKADFSQYHTYQWMKVQTTNPLWEQRIRDVVDKDLQSKGWQKMESGADVALTAVGSATNQQVYQTFYTGMGPWWWRGFGDETTTTVENYKVGTLVLDMYDTRTKRLIWRGTARDTLSDKPSKNEKKLDKTVDKMFEKFPPKGKE